MMAQATKEKSIYREAWEASQRRASRDLPAWAARLREDAFDTFERLGFPTTGEEDWKYTNVAPIARAFFAPPSSVGHAHTGGDGLAKNTYNETAHSRLVFVNGSVKSEL